MSKSTPLSQLRNNSQQPPAQPQEIQETNENMLVNEILQEIEGSQPQMQPQQPQQQVPQVPQPVLELPPQQQQFNNNVQMNVEEQVNNFPDMVQFNQEVEEKGFVSQLLDSVKMSVIVGLLVVLFNISQVTRLLTKIVPERLPFLNYRTQLVLLLKFILGSITYFSVSKIV